MAPGSGLKSLNPITTTIYNIIFDKRSGEFQSESALSGKFAFTPTVLRAAGGGGCARPPCNKGAGNGDGGGGETCVRSVPPGILPGAGAWAFPDPPSALQAPLLYIRHLQVVTVYPSGFWVLRPSDYSDKNEFTADFSCGFLCIASGVRAFEQTPENACL